MPLLDDFNGTNGNSLPTHNSTWIGLTGTASNLQITDEGRARCTGTASSGNYWDVSRPANTEVYSDLHLKTKVNGSIHYWCARGRKTGTTNHFIWGRLNILNSSSAQWQIGEAVDGTFSTIKSSSDISPNPVTGDTFTNVRLIPNGTGGALWVNGTKVLELNDTTEKFSITGAGYCGLRIVPNTTSSNTVGGHYDNFGVQEPGGTTFNQSMSASITRSATLSTASTIGKTMAAPMTRAASIEMALSLSQSMSATMTRTASVSTTAVIGQAMSAAMSRTASIVSTFLPGGGVYGAVSKWLSNVRSAIKLTVTSVIGKNK